MATAKDSAADPMTEYVTVTIGDHIYTTDFFQVSAFNPNHQIISVYYFVHCADQM